MKRYALLMATLMFLAGGLAGCSKDEQAKPAAKSAKPVTAAKPPATQVPPPETQAETAPVPEARYVYQVEGRRDPFLPLLAVKGKASLGREFENPLEAYDLVQYQLKGLIVGFGEPKAIIAAPDGKSYILKKGVRIGKSNGVVRDINRERILVEEQYQDLTGVTHTNIQEIKVPKREGV